MCFTLVSLTADEKLLDSDFPDVIDLPCLFKIESESLSFLQTNLFNFVE